MILVHNPVTHCFTVYFTFTFLYDIHPRFWYLYHYIYSSDKLLYVFVCTSFTHHNGRKFFLDWPRARKDHEFGSPWCHRAFNWKIVYLVVI